jgi:hypothetical protein
MDMSKRTFCKHTMKETEWFWQYNPVEEGYIQLANSVGVAQHKMACGEPRTHHPVWVHPLIAGLILARGTIQMMQKLLWIWYRMWRNLKVDTLIDIFSDDGHHHTAAEERWILWPWHHMRCQWVQSERKLSKFVDGSGSEVDERGRAFLQTQKNEVGVFHGVWGTKRYDSIPKYSSISLKDDIDIGARQQEAWCISITAWPGQWRWWDWTHWQSRVVD